MSRSRQWQAWRAELEVMDMPGLEPLKAEADHLIERLKAGQGFA